MEKYFDYNATTPMAKEVVQLMSERVQFFGNPSSSHKLGRQSKVLMEKSRMEIARLLGTTASKICFTSGGSESNSMIIKGILHKYYKNPGHIITSCIEHPSIIEVCKYLSEQFGFDVTFLPVDKHGFVCVDDFREAIRSDTQFATIMFANNEIGTMQSIPNLARIAKENSIYFHTDAIQAIGKIPINLKELGVNALSFSAHKFYGPKGIGGLFIEDKNLVEPLVHGGGQEGGLRSGTENVLSILGIGKAAEITRSELDHQYNKLLRLKQMFLRSITESFPNCKINGSLESEHSLPNTINVSFPGVSASLIASQLNEEYEISVSVGSACSSRKKTNLSHVLKAIGLTEKEIKSSIRISLGRYTTEKDVILLVSALKTLVNKIHNKGRQKV